MIKRYLIAVTVFLIVTLSSLAKAEDFTVTIKRTSMNSGSVTGELYVGSEFLSHTLELPWKGNASYISSIPPGTYKAHLRYDKNDKWRLQLDNVPGRSGIQIHIGNYPSQIQGCVLVGERVVNQKNKIESSTNAYKKIKRAFYGSDSPNMTPDRKISVVIKYNTSRTKLENDKGAVWLYDDKGDWLYGPQKLLNKEYKRDSEYIYIKYRGPNTYFRFPIFGGYSEMAQKENGPWRKGSSYYKRVN